MIEEEFNYLKRVWNMAFYTQRQGFKAKKKDKGIERRKGRPGVTQENSTSFNNVGGATCYFWKYYAVVSWVWFWLGTCQKKSNQSYQSQ